MVFLSSNTVGFFLLKIVSIQTICPQVAKVKMWRNCAELSMKTAEVPFSRLLVD
jgi:hypothetical protein